MLNVCRRKGESLCVVNFNRTPLPQAISQSGQHKLSEHVGIKFGRPHLMREICMSGSMSGERKRSNAAWPEQPRLSRLYTQLTIRYSGGQRVVCRAAKRGEKVLSLTRPPHLPPQQDQSARDKPTQRKGTDHDGTDRTPMHHKVQGRAGTWRGGGEIAL
jgi:hypothetical protein